MAFKQRLVGRGECADFLQDQAIFDGGDLGFYATGHVQSGGTPFDQCVRNVVELGRNGDDKQISRPATLSDDYCRTNLTAGQVCERNREQDDFTFGEGH